MLYNSPLETAQSLIANQGDNSRCITGTCGICQSANLLRLSGINITEDDTLNIAIACGIVPQSVVNMAPGDPDKRGGTSCEDRQRILNQFNLPTYVHPIDAADRESSVSALADAIRTGHGVIVSVDAGRLWQRTDALGCGHAIMLLSVSDRGDTFVYHDTARGSTGVLTARKLAFALSGRPANITTNVIR